MNFGQPHRWSPFALALVLVVAVLAYTPAVSASVGGSAENYNRDVQLDNDLASDQELEKAYWDKRRIEAAQYRIERLAALSSLPVSYHQQALRMLKQGQTALREMNLPAARSVLIDALEEYGYSFHASAITHELLRSYLISGDLRRARRHLIDLWERYPDYELIPQALEEALTAAEYVQQTGVAFNLDAETPQEVINYDARGNLRAADHIFHFLARYGDRRIAAPRAHLGIARTLLLEADQDEERLIGARIAYDRFLDLYPKSPQVFNAIIEQAVSYLLNYRGAKYDTGVLLRAGDLIEQAALYVDQNSQRQQLVTRMRGLIRRWRQDRDLASARWYRDRGYNEPSRYYYTEVIGRDAASTAADTARRERAELPTPSASGLGSPVDSE